MCIVRDACGRPAFRGETLSDTLAAVLEREPDWSALPADTPAPLKGLLRRLLEKDTRSRLRDIADARFDLETPSTLLGQRHKRKHRRWPEITTAAVAVLLLGVLFWTWLIPSRERAAPISFLERTRSCGNSQATMAARRPGRLHRTDDHSRSCQITVEQPIWFVMVSGGDTVRLTNDPSTESSVVYWPTARAFISRAPMAPIRRSGELVRSAARLARSQPGARSGCFSGWSTHRIVYARARRLLFAGRERAGRQRPSSARQERKGSSRGYSPRMVIGWWADRVHVWRSVRATQPVHC